jgi:hypothetical protein
MFRVRLVDLVVLVQAFSVHIGRNEGGLIRTYTQGVEKVSFNITGLRVKLFGVRLLFLQKFCQLARMSNKGLLVVFALKNKCFVDLMII